MTWSNFKDACSIPLRDFRKVESRLKYSDLALLIPEAKINVVEMPG
jgi:hypothetical protein